MRSRLLTARVKSANTFGEAWVEGYEDLIPSMTNQEKDRHILAAAVRCGAETIVTYNLKDFPVPLSRPIQSQHKALARFSQICMSWTEMLSMVRWNNKRPQ